MVLPVEETNRGMSRIHIGANKKEKRKVGVRPADTEKHIVFLLQVYLSVACTLSKVDLKESVCTALVMHSKPKPTRFSSAVCMLAHSHKGYTARK